MAVCGVLLGCTRVAALGSAQGSLEPERRFAEMHPRRCIRVGSVGLNSGNLWLVGLCVCCCVAFGSMGRVNGLLGGCCSLRQMMSTRCHGTGKMLLEFLKFSAIHLVQENLTLCLKPVYVALASSLPSMQVRLLRVLCIDSVRE